MDLTTLDPVERLMAEQAVLASRDVRKAMNAAPHGRGLEFTERAVLTADVGENDAFTIHLHGPNGEDLNNGTLPEGAYRLELDDYSTMHNFHLLGLGTVSCVPQSDCATTEGDVGHYTWTVNLTPGLVEYVCDPHRGSMHGMFTVTGVGPQPLPPAPPAKVNP